MTFKLRSEALVYQYSQGQRAIPHVVYFRERSLRPGSVIKAKGNVARDVETKTGMIEGDATITAIDDERLHISFRRGRINRIFDSDRDGYWEDLIIEGTNSYGMQKLGDVYHSVLTHTLPEAFTLLDRIRITGTIRAKLRELGDDPTRVQKETRIVYEPTLPSQARK